MITIVNYGSGNIQAILNIYKQLNINCYVANSPEGLKAATKLILPGVGDFDKTMDDLNSSGLRAELDRKVKSEKTPVIGICVGMQLLANKSEEGSLAGLGYIPGEVKKLDETLIEKKPHIPHMGWNSIRPIKSHPILRDIDIEYGFYFLHNYYFSPYYEEDCLTKTYYGMEFCSAVHRDNVFGMQFHPEKSHSNGVKLFKNFANI